ncbi:MAG: hypothetical protein AMXMBFR84_32840 [Candidatus Hydrogenedentota bacterium]
MFGVTYNWRTFSQIARIVGIIILITINAKAAPLPFSPVTVLLDGSHPFASILENASNLTSAGFGGVVLPPFVDVESATSAHKLLFKSGLTSNFARISLDSETPAFTSEAGFQSWMHALESQTSWSNSAGFTGVVLRVDAQAFLFTLAWDGHSPDIAKPNGLIDHAYATGGQLADAVWKSWPSANVLLEIENAEAPGPLVFPFLAGFARHATGQSKGNCDFLFLTQSNAGGLDDSIFDALWARIRAFLPMDDPANSESRTGRATFLQSPPATDLAWAKLVSTRVILVSPGDNLTLATARSAVDAFTRVARQRVLGDDRVVLTGARGAALYFPQGLAAPMALEGVRDPLECLRIDTHELTRIHPDPSGTATVEAQTGAILIDGLPVAAWTTPAGFWMDTTARFSTMTWPLTCGWNNGSPFHVAGRFDVAAPAQLAFFPSGTAIDLRSGDGIQLRGTLHGPFRTGEPIDLRLLISPRSGAATTHHETVRVPPRTLWQGTLDSPAVGNPCLIESETGDVMVLAVTVSGGIHGITADGSLAWARFDGKGYRTGPVSLVHRSGVRMGATINQSGRAALWRADGTLQWSAQLPAGKPLASVAADVHQFSGEEWIICFDDGRVTALLSSGLPAWRIRLESPMESISVAPNAEGLPTHLILSGDKEVHCLAANGDLQWSAPLEARITAGPISTGDTIVAGLANRDVVWLNVTNGKEEQRTPLEEAAFAVLTVSEGVVAATPSRILLLDGNATLQWEHAGRFVNASAYPSEDGIGIWVDVAGGGVQVYAEDGSPRWVLYQRGAVSIGTPAAVPHTTRIIYAASDFTLSCIDPDS